MPHGHLLSLVLVILIAMVMECKYSNNDLHYVVDKQPTSSGRLTSALAAIRTSATRRCPFSQEMYNGVAPVWK